MHFECNGTAFSCTFHKKHCMQFIRLKVMAVLSLHEGSSIKYYRTVPLWIKKVTICIIELYTYSMTYIELT